jgi:hypothetical protein
VQLTGLGKPMNWLMSRVTTWLAKKFRQEIITMLQEQFATNAREIFSNITISELTAGIQL